MSPEFAVERYRSLIVELKPLLPLHWKELALYEDIPLDPDYDFYQRADDMDVVRFYTARLGGGLIGYVVMTISKRHPHYMGQSFAIADICWVHPDHRNFGVGNALFEFVEAQLKGFVIAVGDKIASPMLGRLLKSRGYAPASVSYSKRL